jgi:sec-independent protein translocase protein TatA
VGMTELLIVLTIVLLVFGAKRVPQLGRSLGSGIREFRKGIADAADDGSAAESHVRKNEEEGGLSSTGEGAPEVVSRAEGDENTRIGKKRQGEA